MATPAAATDIGTRQMPAAKNRLRFVTAASLFDGHDASINIMRRILQSQGAEVIHLGHNRSVEEVVSAAARTSAYSAGGAAASSPPRRASCTITAAHASTPRRTARSSVSPA